MEEHLILAAVLPFVILLFTRLRWPMLLSSVAGGLAGTWLVGLILPLSPWDWFRWLFFAYLGLVSLVMALVEALVASSVQRRGRFLRGLAAALAAHAAYLAYVLGDFGAERNWAIILTVAQAAMVGGAAATIAARRHVTRPEA